MEDMHITNAASDNVWNATQKILTDQEFNEMMEICHRDGAYSLDTDDIIITITHTGRGKYTVDIDWMS
jgi:hypothetical protein